MHTHVVAYEAHLLPSVGKLTAGLRASRKMPEWSRAQPFEKLAQAYSNIQKRGGLVFTLRLHPDAHRSVCGAKDPARAMSRRIQRAFKNAGLHMPDLAFSLEVTPDERNELHLHGAIVLGELDRKVLKKILRDAAGSIAGKSGSRQVQIKQFNMDAGGPCGWAFYPKKGATRTRRVIEHDRVTYIPRILNRISKMDWEQRRGQRVGYYQA